jgi:hypothetical protein
MWLEASVGALNGTLSKASVTAKADARQRFSRLEKVLIVFDLLKVLLWSKLSPARRLGKLRLLRHE